jgi:two-component system osmolarity sensor histidine kinase EnvZ
VRRLDLSLSAQIMLVLVCWLLAGIGLGWVWTRAAADWTAHLDRAERVGAALYVAVVIPGLPEPAGVSITPLAHGEGPAPGRLPPNLRETRLSILSDPLASGRGADGGGGRVDVVIATPGRALPVAGLDHGAAHPAERMGQILRSMARVCSDAVIYARPDGGGWLRIGGHEIWSCAAAPADHRIAAALLAGLVLALTLGALANQAHAVQRVVQAMSDRFGGVNTRIPEIGPRDLRALARGANALAAREKARLESRAQALAGISHDLGTPATRLRLRAEMISDDALRGLVSRDIAQMTDMIEAALTLTREEMVDEPPQPVSVRSLVESVVDDFADFGAPVSQDALRGLDVPSPGTLLSAPAQRRKDARYLLSDQRMLALCRPKSLRRAITNLVDNGLKYGRRVQVGIEAEAETLTIEVRDHGGHGTTPAQLAELVAPFARGANARQTHGAGMGLAIVDGIARQHGGGLEFDTWEQGIVARLSIRRGDVLRVR